jgi:hypothetical protein
MTFAKPLLALFALLFAAPALAQLPTVAQIQRAVDGIDACRAAGRTGCPGFERTYRIHSARCMPIAPVGGLPAVACRADMSITDTVPDLTTRRLRDQCARFVLRDGVWTNNTHWDDPCEMPSQLTRDPNAMPARDELESALVGAFQCHDGEDSDCFVYVQTVTLEQATCTPISPDKKGDIRVACRVSGLIGYTGGRSRRPFSDLCIRVHRYTDPGETPAVWGWSYVPEEAGKPCEARARGTDILR